MDLLLGWVLIIFPGILIIGQVISSINFPLAQKLGLQENPEYTDKIVQTVERYTAYWDLITLIWMPIAGILIVINSPFWPIISLLAGAIYFDTAGREAIKNLSFKQAGIRVGSPSQHKFFFSTYIIMAVLGVIVISYSIKALI